MSETDYTKIKQDIVDHFKDLTEFTDYNFEGSAISTLMDILAYNQQNLALQSNLSFSETFLDSANQRSSVVSRAKELGYIPSSSSAAIASVSVTFSVAGNPLQYVIPKNTIFLAKGDSKTYSFTTVSDTIVNKVSNTFSTTLELVQGKLSTYSYTVDTSNVLQKYIIPSTEVDIDYLSVSVNGTIYENFKNYSIGSLDRNSKVFYIFENIDGYYEIYFGDGILGKSVINGDVIYITYLITDGEDANYLNKFTLGSTLSLVTSLSMTTSNPAMGGSARESIDSIKFNAPLAYQKQNRSITKPDYISLIKSNVSGIEDVNVWGGEENIPPYYNKVFISLKPFGGRYISSLYKEKIKNMIKDNYGILTSRTEIVDGDFTDVGVDCTVTYSGKRYNPLASTTLSDQIKASIVSFFGSYGNKFGETIYHSSLLNKITNTSDLILNSILNFTLTKYNKVYFGISGEYSYNFNNYIAPNTIRSNSFVVGGVTYSLKDSPQGAYPYTSGNVILYNATSSIVIGTVNYTTGSIVISNIAIDSIVGGGTELSVTVNQGSFIDNDTVFSDYNIYTNKRNQLIRLVENQISITLLPDNTR